MNVSSQTIRIENYAENKTPEGSVELKSND